MASLSDRLTRRNVLRAGAAIAAVATMKSNNVQGDDARAADPEVRRGNIKQSVMYWCYQPMALETLARHAAAIGLKAIENVPTKDWGILKEHGLICAMTVGHWFIDGLNRKENHPMCVEKLRAAIDANAEAGFPNVVTFSGMRRGMPEDVGLENTVSGLKQVIGYAERKKVNLCLEMLNSRVDAEMKGHPGYMCDRLEWAVQVCKRIASERMKILFDVYHVQIMEGDIISRIRQYREYIGHYHIAGVPGRNEPDDTQELNYPAIMRTILDTGYTGYVGQEFIPTHDPMQSLREAVRICDV